ncbi:hypothetical protein [Pseudomonas sp. MF6747]|uniref:hypothetical protein n=1 Tax=Pseudomonas sp. MF6747 TaxID=2797527 RepID=UPI00190DE4A9|nr:hypothetical protein [Pseudomonas sp. MF6747]MBK3509400.1 hypothetical protein [Pseudomonas sp. MF6747]
MKKENTDLEKEAQEISDADFRELSKPNAEPPKPKEIPAPKAIIGILRNFPIPLTLFMFLPLCIIASMQLDNLNIVNIFTINLVVLLMFGTYAATAKFYKYINHYHFSQLIAAVLMFVFNYCFVPTDKINAAFAATFFIAIAVPFLTFKLFLYATNKAEQSINKAIENNKSRGNLIFFSFFACCLSVIGSYIYFTS